MSRKKGFTAKLAGSEDYEAMLNHAVYGDAYSEQTKSAFALALKLSNLAWEYHLDHAPEEKNCTYKPSHSKAYYRAEIARAGEILINETQDAIEKNDASFFDNLALAVSTIAGRMANKGRHASPERAALLLWGQNNFLVKHSRKLTTEELQALVKKRTGVDLDRRQIQRLCKELNIDKNKRRGRPKKGDN